MRYIVIIQKLLQYKCKIRILNVDKNKDKIKKKNKMKNKMIFNSLAIILCYLY